MINKTINNSPVRSIAAKVELFNGSTLANTFTNTDLIKSINIDRIGVENKFFGFGICQKLNLHLIDIHRELDITTANRFKVYFSDGGEYVSNFPAFKVSEAHRDENTNELSITAYDAIYGASENTVADLKLYGGYSIRGFAEATAAFIGATGIALKGFVEGENPFDTYYEAGANFDGAESLREALDAVAEATQTIYFLDNENRLVFKRLDKDGLPDLEISKNDYISLESKTNRRLTNIVSTTELGDNISGMVRDSATGSIVVLDNVNDIVSVEVRGKNLLNPNKILHNTWDNCIVENGVATQIEADTAFPFSFKIQSYINGVLDNFAIVHNIYSPQKIALSFTCYEPLDFFRCGVNGSITDTVIVFDGLGLPAGTYTFSCDLTNTTQGSISWKDMQLEKGTTATPYTPYIVDTTAARIRAQGKNLFDVSKIITSSTVINNGDGTILVKNNGGQDSGRTFKELCPELKVGDTFTLSLRSTNAVMDSKEGGYIYISGTYTKVLNSGSTYTATQEMLDGGVWLYKAPYAYQEQVEEGIVSEIQVELGTTATEYEPYIAPVEYTQGANIAAIQPTTTLTTDTIGVIMDVIYHPISNLSGTTQYVRDNPFWDLRTDRAALVDNAITALLGFTINQFTCSWRGNYLLEIGDKLSLITKDNNNVFSYVLNDSIKYDGSFKQNTQWNYTDGETIESTPSNLTDAIKQTYAKVDKANKQIEIVVSDLADTKDDIATIEMNTESINLSVDKITTNTVDALKELEKNVENINKRVDLAITAEKAEIIVKQEIEKGTEKIKTATGFTFDDNGLKIAKSSSEITTEISEDGMTINKGSNEVLKADNKGVKAQDLHATTYLIVGTNSRFENYGDSRTGCFWTR